MLTSRTHIAQNTLNAFLTKGAIIGKYATATATARGTTTAIGTATATAIKCVVDP